MLHDVGSSAVGEGAKGRFVCPRLGGVSFQCGAPALHWRTEQATGSITSAWRLGPILKPPADDPSHDLPVCLSSPLPSICAASPPQLIHPAPSPPVFRAINARRLPAASVHLTARAPSASRPELSLGRASQLSAPLLHHAPLHHHRIRPPPPPSAILVTHR